MRIKIQSGLLLLNLLVIVLVAAIILFPLNILRIVMGFPFVLFFPGYALMAALFPRRAGMGGIERVALSFGLSIAVVVLMLLILNYAPCGIRLESILYSIASFIFIISVIAWFRQKRLIEEERFSIKFHLRLPGWRVGIWDKTLSIILGFTILGALGMMGYVIAMPKVGERFTEFYVLGAGGEAKDYPTELIVGEEARVTIDIINYEGETVSYRLEMRIDGIKNNEMEGITLKHGEKWKNEVSFVPEVAGMNQKVEFLLFRNSEVEPYLQSLRLWINVRQ